jgi:arabinogalactan endo-1,4-beta-galactosidase
VRHYTKSVIRAFAANGTPVSQVAIGNEITQGTLWQFTTLAASATTVTPAGTKTIKVASTSGISPGDTLFIDSLATSNSVAGVADPSTEVVKVASVGTSGADGTGITLIQPLQYPHEGPVTVQDVQDSGHLLFDPTTDQADWSSLTTLLKAGIAGARDGNPSGNPLLVQLHIDRGGDNATATDFVDHMLAAGVNFDVIGLSYYPWYHGPISAMKAQLGYGLYDSADANYPDTQPGYLVSPAGQASYQRDLVSLMASMPGGHGLGAFYWDADGQGYLGMFTTNGAAQPVIDANEVG